MVSSTNSQLVICANVLFKNLSFLFCCNTYYALIFICALMFVRALALAYEYVYIFVSRATCLSVRVHVYMYVRVSVFNIFFKQRLEVQGV